MLDQLLQLALTDITHSIQTLINKYETILL